MKRQHMFVCDLEFVFGFAFHLLIFHILKLNYVAARGWFFFYKIVYEIIDSSMYTLLSNDITINEWILKLTK